MIRIILFLYACILSYPAFSQTSDNTSWSFVQKSKNTLPSGNYFKALISVTKSKKKPLKSQDRFLLNLHLHQSYLYLIQLESFEEAKFYMNSMDQELKRINDEVLTSYFELSKYRYLKISPSLGTLGKNLELKLVSTYSHKEKSITGYYFLARVNGQNQIFILDSGSPHCMIPRHMLPKKGKVKEFSINQQFVSLDEFYIGDLDLSGITCKVSQNSKFGILGIDFLAAVNNICIVKSGMDLKSVIINTDSCKKGESIIDAKLGFYELAHTQVDVLGNHYKFRIDTGASFNVLKRKAALNLPENIKITRDNEKRYWTEDSKKVNVDLSVSNLCVSSGSYAMDSKTYIDHNARLIDAHWSEASKLDGNLGANYIFSSDHVFWDFKNRKIYLDKSKGGCK